MALIIVLIKKIVEKFIDKSLNRYNTSFNLSKLGRKNSTFLNNRHKR